MIQKNDNCTDQHFDIFFDTVAFLDQTAQNSFRC